MSFIDRLYHSVDQGRLGLNIGLPMGLPKVEAVVDGVQRKTYSLIFGTTGSGKTTFALYAYLYRPLMECMGTDKFKTIYYSLEMTGEILLAKLMSLFIYENYGVELSYKQIMSRQEILSEENYQIVLECRAWLEEVSKHIIIYDKGLNADIMYAHLIKYAKANGQFFESENNTLYVPNVENQITNVIIDHIGLLRRANGRDKKSEIDLASNYLITLRNKCGFSPVVLMQTNRTSSSMDRRNAEMQELQLSDIKDSGGPSEDSEVVLGIFNPFREKMSRYKGYNIRELKDKFRAVQILKSRLGEADKSIGVNFFGSIGYWRDMPKADEIAESEYHLYTSLIEQPELESVVETGYKPDDFDYTL